jgi:DNA invertase Pin-like site-specific DNA recombinase
MAYKKRDELLVELEAANRKIAELEQRIIELESFDSVRKIKNERNAGRKRKFTVDEIAIIDMLHLQGKSIRAIAKEMNCSVGLVHKLLNEPIGERGK